MFLLAFLSILIVAPSAGALTSAAPKGAVKVTPRFQLGTAAVKGSSISPTIAVTFAAPKAKTVSKSCKGQVVFTAPIGKRTVKKHGKKRKVTRYAKKRAQLKVVEGIAGTCGASGAIKLPATLVGKKVKFTAAFKGNSAVKKFKKSARLTIQLPAAPPEPPTIDVVKGTWNALGTDSKGEWQHWRFTVNPDGSVSNIQRLTPLNVSCPGYSSGFKVAMARAPFDTPFSMTHVDTTAADNFQGGSENIDQTFKLHFDSVTHATGSFQLTGTVNGPVPALEAVIAYPGCDTGVINLELNQGDLT
jgi:hypothetical protein